MRFVSKCLLKYVEGIQPFRFDMRIRAVYGIVVMWCASSCKGMMRKAKQKIVENDERDALTAPIERNVRYVEEYLIAMCSRS